MTNIKNLERIWSESPDVAKRFVPKYLRTKIKELTDDLVAALNLLNEIELSHSVVEDMADFKDSGTITVQIPEQSTISCSICGWERKITAGEYIGTHYCGQTR